MKYFKASLLTAITFGLSGPVFGTLAYAAWAFTLGDEPPGLLGAALATLWMLPFGFVLGFVPAVVTGLIAGFAQRRLAALPFVALSAALGAAVAVASATVSASSLDLTEGVRNLAAVGALAGALSGALSRLFLGSRTPRA